MRWFLLLLCLAGLAVVVTYRTVPSGTTEARHFDTLIVLGCPANPDGTASPEERERVLEAVRELRAGRADHIILTGAAAHNRYTEADVMARFAEQQGVPAQEVLLETRAENTIQNIFYSQAIMQRQGWRSAEVISSPSHLPRTALILEHWPFPWKTDAAQWPVEYSSLERLKRYTREALGTTRFRWFGFPATPLLPGS